MDFTEQYQDILQNIEFAAIKSHRENSCIMDHHIAEAYRQLKKLYTGKDRGWKTLPQEPSNPEAAKVYRSIIEMLDFRQKIEAENSDSTKLNMAQVDSKVLIACFEKLESSVTKWTNGKKSSGYIDFVSPFIQ